MNRKLSWLAFAAAFMGMGISMPSCPGQQAMQQQIDGVQTKQGELTRQVQTLSSQVQTLNTEMTQAKTLLSQVSNTVLEQKTHIEQMDAALKAATARLAPAPAAPRGKKRR